MKLKVLVIGINLKNRVATHGEIIDSSELPNPEMLKSLTSGKDPYLAEVKKPKKAKTPKKVDLTKLNIEQLLKYADDNKIVITTEGKSKIDTILTEIAAAQEVE